MAILGTLLALLGCTGVASYKKLDNDSKKEAQKRATKTNVALQNYYEQQIRGQLQKEYEALAAEGMDKENIMLELFKNHDIPNKDELAKSDTLTWHVRYNSMDELVYMITLKNMHTLGYQYAVMGKDSSWQEAEKEKKEHDRIKNKYRWL